MRRTTFISTCFGCLIGLTAPVLANEVGDTRLSFGASTFGPTVEAAYRFRSNFSFRGVAGGLLSVSTDLTLDGRDYNTEVEPQGFGAMLDWHTGLGGLRLSAGAMYINPTFNATTITTAGDAVTIGNTTIGAGETISATIDSSNKIAPMISIGYDQPIGRSNWVISGEIGAMYNGGYDVTVSTTVPVAPAGTDPAIASAAGQIAQEELQREADSIAGDILNGIDFYPYVSLMIGFKF